MIKTLLGVLALQLSFGLILAVAILLGQSADSRCMPMKSKPSLKDCHPYPEAGPGAMACTWIDSPHEQFPWAPTRRCESP